MGIYTQLPADLEVDVIIAGGGTAGCVVAGRLAEADPNLSVLLIEGGMNNYNVPNIVHPALSLDHLAPTSKTTIFWQANKAPQLAGRNPIVPSGGVLGGGSSINFSMYTRGQRTDYDSWETPGWSTNELIPFLKKLETYHGQGNPAVHGFDGPVHISDGGYRAHRPTKEFINGAVRVGYPFVHDLCDLDSNNSVAPFLRYSSPDGKRQDSAHCYIHPLLQDGKHPNLHVLVETKVVRVLFDHNKRATGVEFVPNPSFHPTVAPLKDGTVPQSIRARKLVVLSTGAIGTPGVLERSGVGDKDVLAKAGIPVVADVPGVGHEYEDHHLVLWPYQTDLKPHETNDAIVTGRIDRNVAIAEKQRRLGWNFVDAAVKARPSEQDVAKFDPHFQAAWNKDFKDKPNRPMMFFTMVETFVGDPTTVPEGQYVTIANYTAYPYSRGHVHITGPALSDPLDFDIGILADAHDIDLKKQIWAYKKHREIMRRTDFYRGEVASAHPKFPARSKAACVSLLACPHYDPDRVVADLEYSAEDDAAIAQCLREIVGTTWHSLGTVKMAPFEKMGGVDASLNVYGVSGLKVCDLSIVPKNVAANTNNTAFLVGEKGADIIMRELGLVKDS